MNYTFRLIRLFGISLFGGLIILLCISLVRFGLFYTYDFDELYHSQLVYLLNSGYIPYKTVFTTYTVLFHWLLSPIGELTGYSLNTLLGFRVLMAILFGIRVVSGMVASHLLFGKKAAVIFLGLVLIEPFGVFTSTQIRPDNLMITLFSIALLMVIVALKQGKLRWFLLAGFCLGSSVLCHIKIAPSVTVFSILLLVKSIQKKQWKKSITFIASVSSSVGIYCLFFLQKAAFFPMVQQVIFDPYSMQKSLGSRVQAEFFFRANNSFLYGFLGKPNQWYFAQFFPITALFCVCILIYLLWKKKQLFSWKRVFLTAVLLSIFCQTLFLFSVPTVYIQYFIPLYWMLLFVTAGIGSMALDTLSKNKRLYAIAIACLSILYANVAWPSILSNFIRTGIVVDESLKSYTIKFGMFQTDLRTVYQETWQLVAPNASVFPALVFRKMPYPLGQFFYPEIPSEIVSRYKPVIAILEEEKIPYIIMSDYQLTRMPVEFQKYLEQNYTRISPQKEVYKRV